MPNFIGRVQSGKGRGVSECEGGKHGQNIFLEKKSETSRWGEVVSKKKRRLRWPMMKTQRCHIFTVIYMRNPPSARLTGAKTP